MKKKKLFIVTNKLRVGLARLHCDVTVKIRVKTKSIVAKRKSTGPSLRVLDEIIPTPI